MTADPLLSAIIGRSNRRRGADAERTVVAWLRDNGWPDARRYLAGDGRQPGDIDGVPGVVLEVKDTARSAWPSWRAQVLEQANGRVPIVVRRTRGVTDVGLWDAETVLLTGQPMTLAFYPTRECRRTGLTWFRLPFGELMEALR